MVYEIPVQPASGIAVDGRGITWRRGTEGVYDPDPCPGCGLKPVGGLSWERLLAERGPLSDQA